MKKRFTFLGLFLLILVSCQKADIDPPAVMPASKKNDPVVTKNEVGIQAATYLANMFSGGRTIKKIEPKVYRPGDTIMYVVSYDKGWMLISGDKRATPILAQSDAGEFSSQETNPGAAIWIDNLADQIIELKKGERRSTKAWWMKTPLPYGKWSIEVWALLPSKNPHHWKQLPSGAYKQDRHLYSGITVKDYYTTLLPFITLKLPGLACKHPGGREIRGTAVCLQFIITVHLLEIMLRQDVFLSP